ncbi:MAG: RluA family pseudouridine synthase [Humidesulfovibrio sp.]|uniref:RluA family pseudouridine synthase n=1 Tax=Humidesulfovibrio sp. TaxID=2910988 RepID=UPI0027ED1BC4|nr:RluA family pseudouridine synthase [Humidesulfovibrio sp.]MDQ7835431.1 RluA family pseudouridine synthase [Humidesulfovibrio sp.]
MEHNENQLQAQSVQVNEAMNGQRLDKVLEQLMPGSGLRLRRRLIESGRVLVQGRPATPSLKVLLGQRVDLLAEERSSAPTPKIAIVKRTMSFAALLKPAGMHSSAIAGRSEPCVEAHLPELFPDSQPVLLNRLDNLTSGLLLVALKPQAQKDYALMDTMKVTKEYVAIVVGKLDEALELRRALDSDDRRRTRVLAKLDPERRNWTFVWPVEELPGGLTKVRVQIYAGARHQIRAHLAAAMLPILGDPLYGEGDIVAPRMFLHHRRIAFPRFEAEAPENWTVPVLS